MCQTPAVTGCFFSATMRLAHSVTREANASASRPGVVMTSARSSAYFGPARNSLSSSRMMRVASSASSGFAQPVRATARMRRSATAAMGSGIGFLLLGFDLPELVGVGFAHDRVLYLIAGELGGDVEAHAGGVARAGNESSGGCGARHLHLP